MLEKVKSCGMTAYSLMVKPLPVVIRKAVLSYWLTVIITGIAEWAFYSLTGHKKST